MAFSTAMFVYTKQYLIDCSGLCASFEDLIMFISFDASCPLEVDSCTRRFGHFPLNGKRSLSYHERGGGKESVTSPAEAHDVVIII